MASALPPSPTATQLLDAQSIQRAIRRIAHEIVERNPDLQRIALIGIPLRGVEVSKRLADCIEHFEKIRVDTGSIDVSMHRDDIGKRGKLSPVEASHLPLELQGRTLILCDDVAFTGRTCRAAMDAIASFGRPARIQLAVLVDRGHRELPIRADYVGKNLPTAPNERVYVRFQETDGAPDSVWVDKG
jgi:pyrimidine operon attenuation protein/uracil phosphoribosyltransferase